MRELDVVGVRVEMPSNAPMVLLREVGGTRYLPIWIGASEASAIANAQEGVVPPRPLTHDLMVDTLNTLGHRLTEVHITELERTQILQPKRGSAHYGRDALTLAIAARRLAEYGIDGRHLRAFKISADREVGLVEQAIAPHLRRAGGNKDVSGEVTQLVISFHAALVRTAMER